MQNQVLERKSGPGSGELGPGVVLTALNIGLRNSPDLQFLGHRGHKVLARGGPRLLIDRPTLAQGW